MDGEADGRPDADMTLAAPRSESNAIKRSPVAVAHKVSNASTVYT